MKNFVNIKKKILYEVKYNLNSLYHFIKIFI